MHGPADSRREADNLLQIQRLNQRGGQTLSIVDLIQAGTLDADVAGFLLYTVAHGASFLTAARPGNAGKSTVLANLLGFLPPGTRIVAPDSLPNPAEPDDDPGRICVLAHEIGSGPYYGYIWGAQVHAFLALARSGYTIASCMHADTLDELTRVLAGPPLGVPPAHLAGLDLILFMRLQGAGWTPTRRIGLVCEASGACPNTHRPLFEWDPRRDRFERLGDSALLGRLAAALGKTQQYVDDRVAQCTAFVRLLCADGATDFAAVRREVVRFLTAELAA